MILNIELAESVTGSSPEEFSHELCLAAAAQLYRKGRVSSGRAAQLAGVGQIEFLNNLSRFGVPAINISAEDFDREAEFVARHF